MEYVQLLIYGIVFGSIIALGAIGLSLLYGILRFANFAHGDYMTVGAYLAFVFVATLQFPMYIAFPLAMVGGALMAIAIDRVLYRQLRRSNAVILLIASVGMALILRSLVQLIWGSDIYVYVPGIRLPYRFWDLRVKPDHIVIVAGAVAIMLSVHLFLTRTRMGNAMRAMSDNADLARITGIDTERVIRWTWAIGAALTAAAGVFLAMDTQLHPVMGWKLLLPVFAAAILGGIGRPYGAIAGGLVIGVVQEYSTVVVDPSYKPAVAFAIMVIVLIVRPQGLFAGIRT